MSRVCGTMWCRKARITKAESVVRITSQKSFDSPNPRNPFRSFRTVSKVKGVYYCIQYGASILSVAESPPKRN